MRWFLGLILLLAAAFVLKSGLLAYAAYVLLGVLVGSRFLARSWIEGLSATRSCRKRTAAIGERVTIRLTIHNESGLRVLWVLIEDVLPRRALDKRFPRLKVKGRRVRIATVGGGGTLTMKYSLECLQRGYYQLGPAVLETGDLFGLHRRFRVAAEPSFLLVYPRVVTVRDYDIASRRPIGDIRISHRLYEDPTRIAGVRVYEPGDPLNRVHWKATARTGLLHTKLLEPSTLTGATIVLDFHDAGYPQRGEPMRSELAVTTAVSLANAVCDMGQQIGLVTNGRDAADRIRTEGWEADPRTRQVARQSVAMAEASDRLQPLIVETRRGIEQMQRIREVLARVEMTDGFTFAQLLAETTGRLPRDATVLAVLPRVPVETAISLARLRRAGLAVSVVLVHHDGEWLERAYTRLIAQGVRDIRHVQNESDLAEMCGTAVQWSAPYDFVR